MGATGGKKDQRPKTAEQFTSYRQKCQWKKIADFLLLKNSKPLDVKLFSIGSVYSCFQTPRAGKSVRWNKVACRSLGKKVSKIRSTTELTCSSACRETYSLWEFGQTPLKEKLQNDTSADRVPPDFRNSQRKDFIILLLKSTKIKSSSNFSHLQLSTALLLEQKKKKGIPCFYIACTSEEPQAMESAWDKWTNLFCRFWEVHSQGEWGQPEEKKTRDQKLLSNSHLIAKNVNEIKLLFSCCWKIENLWISNFSHSEVSTVVFKQQDHGKRLAKKRWPVDREAEGFRKPEVQTKKLGVPLARNQFTMGNWDKHHWMKNHTTRHL